MWFYIIVLYLLKIEYVDITGLVGKIMIGGDNMKCMVTELEIETIYNRIKEKDLNLSPEFQRGEVWTLPRKKKLIDSILRGWRIPPIHLIENEDFIDEVLDGQQRLAAIRDFLEGEFKVDGNLQPIDEKISELHQLSYNQLDDDIRRKFKKYSLTIIRLTEFSPEEPAELFFRLNQPATLTSAEQRNSYIGETRNQIKSLVSLFEKQGANSETIGFSNSRMAYDDVISKFCYSLEIGNLKKKITSNNISDKYRRNDQFSEVVIKSVEDTLIYFIESSKKGQSKFIYNKLNINKATLYSWLVFSYRNMYSLDQETMSEIIHTFEFAREVVKGKAELYTFTYENVVTLFNKYKYLTQMVSLFNQRASMSSTDAMAIIHRDIILEMYLILYTGDGNHNQDINAYLSSIDYVDNFGRFVEKISTDLNWGGKIPK